MDHNQNYCPSPGKEGMLRDVDLQGRWIWAPGFCAASVPCGGCPRRPGDAGGAGFFSSGADAALMVRSLWRNGRARWTSNPEVPGSSPGRDDLQAGVSFILCMFHHRYQSIALITPLKA